LDKILIIDDEAPIRDILSSILADEGYETFQSASGEEGIELLKNNDFSVVFLDLWLPNINGMEVLKIIKKQILSPEVIIISGHANVDVAVQAIKDGAYDCLEKPLDLTRVLTLTRNSVNLNRLKKENIALKSKKSIESLVIGESDEVVEIKKIINQIAPTDSRVLILGENGTGKEVVAREIHNNSLRKNKPFIEVNCAAIPENLLESELFGHEKGAFTGAHERRLGKFELANEGTLFLDEIADMSLTAQAKVLRAIQEQRFHRVGSEKIINVDIRIISATNKNIQNEIIAGKFREDLFFRLNVIPMVLPPLRERGQDIEILANFFLEHINKTKNENFCFLNDSISELYKHKWPGNVRELKNYIEKVSIISQSSVIDLKKFPLASAEEEKKVTSLDYFLDLTLAQAKEEFEKEIICSKLEKTNGNITKAAGELGIYPSNLHSKMNKYRIEIQK